MQPISRILAACLVFVLFAVTTLPAAAQSDIQTVTITEAQLNDALEPLVLSDYGPIESMSLNLRAFEIGLIAEGQRPNRQSFAVEGVIVPSVSNYRLFWTLARTETVDTNNVISPRDPASGQATGIAFMDVWERAFTSAARAALPLLEEEGIYFLRSVDVLAVTISEDAITIQYQLGGSNPRVASDDPLAAPAASDGSSNTIMFTEQQANDALAAIARRNEAIESCTVDFTPNGVKVEVQVIGPQGQTAGIIAILIGLLVDPGTKTSAIQWSMTNPQTSGIITADVFDWDNVVGLWTQLVNLQIPAGSRIDKYQTTHETMIIAILIGL